MSKIAVIYSGQGTQSLNMGLDFYNEYECYKSKIDKVEKYISDFKEVVYGNDQDLLNETKYAQFAISSMQVGIYDIIKQMVKVECFAGFSLGEYSALYSSGVVELNSLYKILESRTNSMSNVVIEGMMIACLRTDIDHINKLIGELLIKKIECYVANYNTQEQIVISCLKKDEAIIVEHFKQNGVKKVIPLNVSGPFHSPYYKNAANEFYNSLNDIELSLPTSELYLNTTGKRFIDEDLKKVCEKQMYSQVNWYPLIKNMIDDGVDIFIEIGYNKVLSGFMKKIDKSINVINIQNVEDIKKLEDL